MSTPLDLVVRGGEIVTPRGIRRGDMGVASGRIVRVAPEIKEDAKQTIDATGKWVFPGIIDAHVHYLVLSDDDVIRFGSPAKCAPPLRDEARRRGMWRELCAGAVDTVGSDHSPAPPDMKTSEDFFAIWGGIAGCQHGYELLFTEARARIDELFPQLAAVLASNVAKRFGLSGSKGEIAEGATRSAGQQSASASPARSARSRPPNCSPATASRPMSGDGVAPGSHTPSSAVFRSGRRGS